MAFLEKQKEKKEKIKIEKNSTFDHKSAGTIFPAKSWPHTKKHKSHI